mmetsp:Transcript_40744/g.86849  ORF Transcript_40744/g.86849 Transcript_40744/m.86849 type:complete len:92 (-) Transcript_40744:58-333(-)
MAAYIALDSRLAGGHVKVFAPLAISHGRLKTLRIQRTPSQLMAACNGTLVHCISKSCAIRVGPRVCVDKKDVSLAFAFLTRRGGYMACQLV